MAQKWYGSISNRIEENRQFCPEIEVGTGMTEYFYSDRHAYEVVAVKDQKHVTVREYDHEKGPGAPGFSNDWILISNPGNPEREMTKRGKYWYWTTTIPADLVRDIDEDNPTDNDIYVLLMLAHNGTTRDEVMEKGKVTRYHRANVSFGVAEYYYDYSF